MLKGISPLLSPELLSVLCRMGHGDELILADAHFPAESVNRTVLRADGIAVAELLDGLLPLFELDSYVDTPLVMMQVGESDTLDPQVEADYRRVIIKHAPQTPEVKRIGRFDFYARAKSAFAVVVTGENRKYGNLLLKKGVTPA